MGQNCRQRLQEHWLSGRFLVPPDSRQSSIHGEFELEKGFMQEGPCLIDHGERAVQSSLALELGLALTPMSVGAAGTEEARESSVTRKTRAFLGCNRGKRNARAREFMATGIPRGRKQDVSQPGEKDRILRR